MSKFLALAACAVAISGCGTGQVPVTKMEPAQPYPIPRITITNEGTQNPLDGNALPIIAVWREQGFRQNATSCLRIAIWENGAIAFAPDPNQWNQELLIGRVDKQAIESLKKEINTTGVFKQKERAYLVPDGVVECVMLAFDGKTALLKWDEVESPSYGINIDPQPQHIAFKKTWYAINFSALSVVPLEAARSSTVFSPSPKWYVDNPPQAE